MKNISFLHVASTNEGGAGTGAQRVHEAMLAAGYASQMLVEFGIQAPGVTIQGGYLARLQKNLSKFKYRFSTYKRYYFRDQAYDSFNSAELQKYVEIFKINVIICYDVTNYMSYKKIADVAFSRSVKVLFFLMDMAPFTGGCHYAWDCNKYQSQCAHCPALFFRSKGDKSFRTHQMKADALARTDALVVAGSGWLANQAASSSLFRDVPINIIPLSVSPDLFRPREIEPIRRGLGLPVDKAIIFFGARQLADKRKGMAMLLECLRNLALRLPSEDLPILLVAGGGNVFDKLTDLGFTVKSLGLVKDAKLAEAYAVSTVFVSPSLEDSGPMMINEAVMTGTIIVGFRTGVLPDLVEDGVTGACVEVGNVEALSDAIVDVLQWPQKRLENARLRARKIGISRCSPTAQAAALASLVISTE